MKKESRFTPKAILVPAGALFVICVVVALLLALTNSITYQKIDEQELLNKSKSCELVLPSATSFEQISSGDNAYYIGKDTAGRTVGYAIITSEKGYGGPIEVMTGITKDNKISGIIILSQNETPGLGANATKEDFRDQYKTDIPSGGFEVSKSKSKPGEIQAMTGATITSKAVTEAVNHAIKVYDEVKGAK